VCQALARIAPESVAIEGLDISICSCNSWLVAQRFDQALCVNG